ncbi:MAG: PQQ-binding-like beta-propeller repeat protein [Verrucomicrobia bacterium]|nr:PQQ-binding-like beta-propeller repeat protein [Verrucomicrobiota bacterium]MCH8527114.1 PQQ-binding-like beta-propeller repeat protein [Kiritimatiellia bacterium]
MIDGLFFHPTGVIPVLINPIAVLLAVLPGMFMALISLFKPKSIKTGIIMLWRMKVQVAILALLGYGLHFGFRTVFPKTAATAAEAEQAVGEWAHFRGDALRRGWVEDGASDPVTGGINWSFREGNQVFVASPALVGNRIYIPSVTIGAFGGLSGSIYSLDADTGALIWRVTPPNYDGSFSSATVKGNYLLVGEGLHLTKDARMICIDISDESNPEILWMFETRDHIEGTPTIDDGRVFFTNGNSGIFGLDLHTGEKLWHLPGEQFNDAETSILAHEGKVYIGLGFGRYGQAIVQVDAASGEVLHRIETPYPVFGPPAVHNGVVYFGMGNGDFVFPAEQRVDYVLDILREQGLSDEELQARRPGLAPGGAVWALDTETMETLWTYDTDRTILSAVSITGDGLYFASRSGGVYHLDFDGSLIAYWNSGEPVVSSMSVTDDHVYLMTSNGMLYVLDSDDLQPVWDLRLSGGAMNFSSPAVGRGQIFIGTEAAGLLSVGEPDDASRLTLWNGDGGPRRAGRADDAPLPAFGAFESNYPESAMGEAGESLTSHTPVAVDGAYLRILNAPEPVIDVSGPSHTWRRVLPAPVEAVAVRGNVLGIHLRGESDTLELMTLSDGSLIAALPLPHQAQSFLTATDDGFLVRLDPDTLSLLDETGEIIENLSVPALSHTPVLTVNTLVALRNEGRQLSVLDRPTGKALWTRNLPDSATATPILDGQRILVPARAGLLAYDIATGETPERWNGPQDPVSDSIVLDRTLLALVTESGEVLLLDRATGRELARHPGALPGFRPLFQRDRLLWVGPAAVHAVPLAAPGTPPVEWVDFSWIGTPTTAPLAHRSQLTLGLTDWGLVTFGEEQ